MSKKPLFIIKVNSAGFGDVLKQWHILFEIGNCMGLEYIHFLNSISLAENHKDNKKSIFKRHPFFLQFKQNKLINKNDFEFINIEIKASNKNIGLTQKDLNNIKINLNPKYIYVLSFPEIYSTEINLLKKNIPIKYLTHHSNNSLIIHIRRGDTSFLPITEKDFLCPSGNIYSNFAQVLVNEKTIRERYIPISFFIKNLENIINKNISKIIICSDGYTIMEKHIDLILEKYPTLLKSKNDFLNYLSLFEKNELQPLTDFIKSKNINFVVYSNEKKTDLNEMITICKNSNTLVYGKSCFFQNIFKYMYNFHDFNSIKIEPPYFNFMKNNKLVNEPRNYNGKYLIDLNSQIIRTFQKRGIFLYRNV